MEYKIIVRKVDNAFVRNVDKAAKELSRQVTEQLGSGWEPVGNVTLGVAGTAPYLLQALVKRK
jgi:hypothetical protein